MKIPEQGMTLRQQARMTNKIVATLVSCGFVCDCGTMYKKQLAPSKLILYVKPPTEKDDSWSFLGTFENDPERHWMGGNGTLSFSPKWATPAKVMDAVFDRIACRLYNNGVSHQRAATVKAIEPLLKLVS